MAGLDLAELGSIGARLAAYSSLGPGGVGAAALGPNSQSTQGVVGGHVQQMLRWDMELSQQALIYSNDNRTARRPGNVSCYPAALVPVIGAKCSLATGSTPLCPTLKLSLELTFTLTLTSAYN